MRLLRYRENRLGHAARRARQQMIQAGLTRRDMFKLGVLTSSGFLAAKVGLSSQVPGYALASPATGAFIEPMPIPPVKQPVSALSPAPTAAPNTAAGEGRTRAHQAFAKFPPQKLYEVVQKSVQKSVSPDLPLQTLWGFDGEVPGPTYHVKYGEPILVRNRNDLPTENGGFGLNSVSTHLHNGHTPSESDGFPCDFFERGQFYDQHYPVALAGFDSTHPPTGDINESMSTLWYHDHRVDFTAQNVYKGLAGFFLQFNQFDTGDETTGFRLPSGEFDVPIILTDRVFDDTTGLLAFDLFNLDGILGDKFLANGKIQPFFQVRPRRYRFRILDGGPSRFYQVFLTNLENLAQQIPIWHVATDGNLLPKPIQVTSARLGVAERHDLIIDFSAFAGKSIYLENRLIQTNGRGPQERLTAAGAGDLIVRFDVVKPAVTDNSADPATIAKFYSLPSTADAPRVTRNFDFGLQNGRWVINGQFFDCDEVRLRVKRNSVERWVLTAPPANWSHPIHIHFEEFQILSRVGGRAERELGQPVNANGVAISEVSRKDVVRLHPGERITLFFRFRDFVGRYPMHCHNTIHEDHAMMLRWDIDDVGDTNQNP